MTRRVIQKSRASTGERVLALVLMATLLVHLPGLGLVPVSVFPALFLAVPFLSQATRRVRQLVAWTAVAMATGVVALLLTVTSGTRPPTFDTWAPIALWAFALPLLPLVAEWSFKRVSSRTGILVMLAGGIASTLAAQGFVWKGSLGIFVSGFVLILLARRPVLSATALLCVLALSFLNDARSMSVAAGASFVVLIVLYWRRTSNGWFREALILVVSLGSAGALGLQVLVSGLAGPEIQARTVDQLGRANFLFGVRAEWASTIALAGVSPGGYGVGVSPDSATKQKAIAAVQAAGGDWTADYFRNTVFGERVDLHSTIANLWFHFGVGGIAVACTVAVLLFAGLRTIGASLRMFGLGGIFMLLMAAWDLFFSPMADMDRLVAGLVIALAALKARANVKDVDVVHPVAFSISSARDRKDNNR